MSGSAIADAPPAIPPVTICSLSGTICATRGADVVTVWRKLPSGKKLLLWRARPHERNLRVADDGLSLIGIQPLATLVAQDAGPGTMIFSFYRPDRPPIRVTLGQVIRDVPALPRTVSHRQWARTVGYDGRGHFQVDTVEGRHILFDPRTGRPSSR